MGLSLFDFICCENCVLGFFYNVGAPWLIYLSYSFLIQSAIIDTRPSTSPIDIGIIYFHIQDSPKQQETVLVGNTIQIRHITTFAYNKQKMLKIANLIRRYSTIQPHTRLINTLGFNSKTLLFNPTIPQLYEIAIAKKQQDQHKTKISQVSSNGAFVAYSSQKASRTGQNYRIVRDVQTANTVNWNQYNIEMDQIAFSMAQQLAIQYLNHKGNCIVVDGYAGWDQDNRLKVRTFCGKSYHALFMHNMLIKPTQKELLEDFSKGVDINIFNASEISPTKIISGVESDRVTALNLKEKKIAILGNESAQQMKKALFKTLQYYYPRKNILPLRASATVQKNGNVTVFCGLEESQKTSLGLVSQTRKLIGSDEIAWGKDGIFNIEGGCYSKILNHNKVDTEVQNSIRYGTLVQNAMFYPNSRNINFYDIKQSPNAKTSFPLNFMKNAKIPSVGSHPKNIILFTCDTNGVLPAVAKLTPEQAYYHFLAGYSGKINQRDTSNQIQVPKAKFETCFGEQYLSRQAASYGKMLYDKIGQCGTNVWIVNTGWTSGKYGVGKRINAQDTQKIVNMIIDGQINELPTYKMQYFNFEVPVKIPEIQQGLMHPESGWGDKVEFDQAISKLTLLFAQNFHKKFKGKMNENVKLAEKGAPSLI